MQLTPIALDLWKIDFVRANFLSFFDEVTNLIHKSNSDNVIYLDFCKAFDLIPHNILIRKL